MCDCSSFGFGFSCCEQSACAQFPLDCFLCSPRHHQPAACSTAPHRPVPPTLTTPPPHTHALLPISSPLTGTSNLASPTPSRCLSSRRERLQIGLQSWRLQQQLGLANGASVDWEGKDGIGRKEVKGRSSDLSSAAVVISGYVNGVPQTQLVLKEGGWRAVFTLFFKLLCSSW